MKRRNDYSTSQNPHLIPSREDVTGFHQSTGRQISGVADTLAGLDGQERRIPHSHGGELSQCSEQAVTQVHRAAPATAWPPAVRDSPPVRIPAASDPLRPALPTKPTALTYFTPLLIRPHACKSHLLLKPQSGLTLSPTPPVRNSPFQRTYDLISPFWHVV